MLRFQRKGVEISKEDLFAFFLNASPDWIIESFYIDELNDPPSSNWLIEKLVTTWYLALV